jgi:hypothetical protein
MSNSGARLATALILVIVFGSGLLVGMAWDSGTQAAAVELSADPAPDSSTADIAEGEADPPEEGRRQRRRLYDRVDPTEDQKLTMDSIIEFHRDRMGALNDEFRDSYYPRYYGIIDDTRSRIKERMTADQAAQYDSILAEYDRENRNQEGRLPFRRD